MNYRISFDGAPTRFSTAQRETFRRPETRRPARNLFRSLQNTTRHYKQEFTTTAQAVANHPSVQPLRQRASSFWETVKGEPRLVLSEEAQAHFANLSGEARKDFIKNLTPYVATDAIYWKNILNEARSNTLAFLTAYYATHDPVQAACFVAVSYAGILPKSVVGHNFSKFCRDRIKRGMMIDASGQLKESDPRILVRNTSWKTLAAGMDDLLGHMVGTHIDFPTLLKSKLSNSLILDWATDRFFGELRRFSDVRSDLPADHPRILALTRDQKPILAFALHHTKPAWQPLAARVAPTLQQSRMFGDACIQDVRKIGRAVLEISARSFERFVRNSMNRDQAWAGMKPALQAVVIVCAAQLTANREVLAAPVMAISESSRRDMPYTSPQIPAPSWTATPLRIPL